MILTYSGYTVCQAKVITNDIKFNLQAASNLKVISHALIPQINTFIAKTAHLLSRLYKLIF